MEGTTVPFIQSANIKSMTITGGADNLPGHIILSPQPLRCIQGSSCIKHIFHLFLLHLQTALLPVPIKKNMSFYKISCFLMACCITLLCPAQSPSFPILRSGKEYRNALRKNADNRLVELKSRIPGLVYDLRYATTNNFMHRRMYPGGTRYTFMRRPAAEALAAAQKELNLEGLGLKIFDAYRPYSVSQKFWELVKDERYVANPAKGSNHNRGTAVDLTLIDLKTQQELHMGTGFDNFTDTAHHSFTGLPPQVLKNRGRLRSVMERHGFGALDSEWWHYTYRTGTFDVLDLSFKQLSKRP